MQCNHPGCTNIYKKWHNLYDHLRIHTKERPYNCTFHNLIFCEETFAQRSNLNRHIKHHLEVSYDMHKLGKMSESELLKLKFGLPDLEALLDKQAVVNNMTCQTCREKFTSA